MGADPLLVQAAGGNTSLKDDGVMWIKASGTWLKDAASRDIFVPVDQAALVQALAQPRSRRRRVPAVRARRPQLRRACDRRSRPASTRSCRTAIVVHVHCVNTIAWAIRGDARTALASWLREFAWAFVPYARPGLPLAEAIAARQRPGVDVLVLGNHGLVVGADTVGAAEALLERVVSAVTRPAREAVRQTVPRSRPVRGHAVRARGERRHARAGDRCDRAGARAARVYYPDHVVFLGVGVATDIGSGAPLVAVPGKGVLVRTDAKPAVEAMGRCLADVMRRIGPDDPLVALTDEDIDRLVNWDAETGRRCLMLDASGVAYAKTRRAAAGRVVQPPGRVL